jgi:hypothetical protein
MLSRLGVHEEEFEDELAFASFGAWIEMAAKCPNQTFRPRLEVLGLVGPTPSPKR